MEFKKGHWNIDELEIQEWLDSKQKGFTKFDVETLKIKLEEAINDKQHIEYVNASRSHIKVITLDEVLDIISEKFGFEEIKE